jgi:ketosteroid isomerase-like protein
MSQPILQPADINPAFAVAYNAGRVDAFLALYEPDAVLVGRHGAEHRGQAAIARDLAGLLALGGTMTSANRYALVHASPRGDVALLSADWRIETRGPDGAPLVVAGRSAEVARRQPDGRWLYIADHPFGA